jgi:hypothetical protein
MERSTVLVMLMTASFHLSAQEQALGRVNEAFGGSVTFKVDRQHRLVMDFIDENGRYRQDIAPMDHLDPEGVHFSPEEDAIVLKCRPDKAQCISKEIFKLDVVRLTSRSTLPRPVHDGNGSASIALLRALLIERTNEPVELSEEPRMRPSRMNQR